MSEKLSKALQEIALRQAHESIREEALAAWSKEDIITQGLGLAIAHLFKWDGLLILKTMYAALEDSNFHTENKTVGRWIKELGG